MKPVRYPALLGGRGPHHNSRHPWRSNTWCFPPRPPPVLGSLYGAPRSQTGAASRAKAKRRACSPHEIREAPPGFHPGYVLILILLELCLPLLLLIYPCRKASRAPEETGGARRGCLRAMDGPSYAPAPCFRGAQGTGAAPSRRLAPGTTVFAYFLPYRK